MPCNLRDHLKAVWREPLHNMKDHLPLLLMLFSVQHVQLYVAVLLVPVSSGLYEYSSFMMNSYLFLYSFVLLQEKLITLLITAILEQILQQLKVGTS